MKFFIKNINNKARLGYFIINNKYIETPLFMPIGTYGTIKSLDSKFISKIGFKLILSNAFHLFFKPGLKIINKFKGLHNFINWNSLILTDSGGFQVYSLSKFRKINKFGINFIYPNNGKKIFLTPKKIINIQNKINSDIFMVIDDCCNFNSSKKIAKKALNNSIVWAKLCYNEFTKLKNNNKKVIFGILQGNCYKNLRKKSLISLEKINFNGYAIGGVCLGENKKKMFSIIKYCCSLLPYNKPRYVMGIGSPLDILKAVYYGVDMFDCVLPTRNARNGYLYINTKEKIIRIRNKIYAYDTKVLDPTCSCFTCLNYTRSYLYHLYKCKDSLSLRLNSIHNLKYYYNLMKNIRKAIKNKTLITLINNFN